METRWSNKTEKEIKEKSQKEKNQNNTSYKHIDEAILSLKEKALLLYMRNWEKYLIEFLLEFQ